MTTRHRLSAAETVSAVAAVLMFFTLLLPWFEEKAVGRYSSGLSPLVHFTPRNKIAWVGVPFIAVPIVAMLAVPLWNAIKRTRTGRSLRPEVLLASGAVAVALVLLGAAVHLGNQGGSPGPSAVISASPQWGLWVSLVVGLVMASGGAVAMWSKRPTQDGIGPSPGS